MAARNPTPIGEKFNRLTVLYDAPCRPGRPHQRVTAHCECGVIKDFFLEKLRSGKTKSCGCLRIDTGKNSATHGYSGGRTYNIWAGMKSRCLNQNLEKWKDYGGRGITVCQRWIDSFESFLEDMGDAPDGFTLDRKENSGNYEKSNCRWATSSDQANNTRQNRFLEFNGKRMTISHWADEIGIDSHILYNRLRRGWSVERAITEPPRCQPAPRT